MEKEVLIELLGLNRWHKQREITEYLYYSDEREDKFGKPLEYLDIKPSDYKEGEINKDKGITVIISSHILAEIEKISRLVTDVLNNGVQFYSFSPRYYFTELANLKLDLISKATEDARLRAEKIVDKSGASLGDLLNADMGILQIVGQNSDESYSWGGTFNTSSKKKTASITIELRYKIEN